MNQSQWQCFYHFREDYKAQCETWSKSYSQELSPLQKAAAELDTPDYQIETPVVYNTALNKITQQDKIKLIVIGDNPGKAEQLSCNRQYLVGQSGKIAQGFFQKNTELGIDFRKNVIILNKTPVHTAKTTHLRYLQKNGSQKIAHLIKESQIWCAEKTAELHQNLNTQEKCFLWIVGYAELKSKGIFLDYKKVLLQSYNNLDSIWNKVLVFQHFSMNRFLIDLKNFMAKNPELNLQEALLSLGTFHRKEIFGR